MGNEKQRNGKGATDSDLERAVSELLTELNAVPTPPKITELAQELQKRLDQRRS
ncbi:hypothetical protein [Ciceribacter sp. L1K22]|uniref:hypothetical protein n=1 Tax=Ciceribacter sp. L1K22 TaxID=2820275 RepID=UPI001ABE85D6|nr:hypothetical protein [Ciceribacter sp. L1K22]MBO3761416.1 hypothetical protein [Ciceribacter sp. L1K22]